jgi:sentrin-specific protease 7
VHIFSTLFFKRLRDQGGYDNVKRWTRSIDVFAYDFLFVPVNYSFHWSLAVVCNPVHFLRTAEAVQAGSEGAGTEFRISGGSFTVILLDSLMCHKVGTVTAKVQSFLFGELHTKKGIALSNTEKRRVKTALGGKKIQVTAKAPQQDNSCDCGVFVCKCVEHLLAPVEDAYGQRRSRLHRLHRAASCLSKRGGRTRKQWVDSVIRPDWFGPGDVARLRSTIKGLISRVKEENDRRAAEAKAAKEARKRKKAERRERKRKKRGAPAPTGASAAEPRTHALPKARLREVAEERKENCALSAE